MTRTIENILLNLADAAAIDQRTRVQTLWSGYGEIVRYHLSAGKWPSLIVKHVKIPQQQSHPHGWDSEFGHYRKLKSYAVESHWYQNQALGVGDACRIPAVYYAEKRAGEFLLVMEDLDVAGFTLRYTPENVTLRQAKTVLSWLAIFHAINLDVSFEGLWESGTYWHLDTRPLEWERMQHTALKNAAHLIDATLKNAKFQTLVHGDAKLANFCFSPKDQVAAVDFQYVGRGCGIKDVAYFLSSCFSEIECEQYEEELLSHYFGELRENVSSTIDFQALEGEWMQLYPFAWADFYRFLDGWQPGHWKMHSYSLKLTQQVLETLQKLKN